MNKILALFSLSSAFMIGSQVLVAQDSIESSKTAPQARRYSVDIQPLPILVDIGLATGAYGGLASFGGEVQVADQIGAYATVGGARIRLSEDQVSKAYDQTTSPVPRKITTAGIAVGGRYYTTSAMTDSWFASGALGATRSMAQWDDTKERVNEDTWVVAPNVEAGYRWLWTNGFLVRLGAGASVPLYATRDYSTAAALRLPAATDIENKVRKQEDRFAVLPALDLALGYAF